MFSYKYFSSDNLVDYADSWQYMQNIVPLIADNIEPSQLWLLEHNHVYTAGISAEDKDLLNKDIYPVYNVERGGKYTYHGPEQLIAYVMFNLKNLFSPNDPDVRVFVQNLEEIIINTLEEIGIKAFRAQGRIGVWVNTKSGEKKIAALGIKLKSWVSFHGISININPQLSAFNNIIPCGISEYGVTSIIEMGVCITRSELEKILIKNFDKVFNASSSFSSTPKQISNSNKREFISS